MTLWEIDIYPAEGQVDLAGRGVAADAADLGLGERLSVAAARGFLVEGELDEAEVQRVAGELLTDGVVERSIVARVGDAALNRPPDCCPRLVHVLPRPGVMDPVAQSAQAAMAELGVRPAAVRTLRKYWLADLPQDQLERLCSKVLANDSIEQVIVGPLTLTRLQLGSPYELRVVHVPLRELGDDELVRLSREGQLYLSLDEMRTIQAHYRDLRREPTDVELETLAQTWSEHCSHKTLKGRIEYRDEKGERSFENLLRETIFAATVEVRKRLGADDWCVSVFEDNAGIVRFDEQYNAAFKVETHNHPSAIEPYGGANTGLGGVIRDILGTGLGARPVCNTDVFCFAPPDTPADGLPPGVLHPRRVMKGVVSGVRDYGNRMGIPTVNGAVFFDRRYLGNPLVFCGTVGLLPREMSAKSPRPGDAIMVIGGRTGRDGIHGATFSSAELTSATEEESGGAVQIGNAITEKMVLDVMLAARDRGLYTAVTDCGAGGLSSAVGEMGQEIGAEVHLELAPLKYEGLSYAEIWISEAQERMVLAVPPEKCDEFVALCRGEGVEAAQIGRFAPTGRLQLKYHGTLVADLSMEFLHDGRPAVVRKAIYEPAKVGPLRESEGNAAREPAERSPTPGALAPENYNDTLLRILGSLNVASKEWIIRQYDHEVQGGSVVKPLVGAANDGPSDAAVVRPVLGSSRGLVIACGMNPLYGDHDTYHMAAGAIDEAIRNCVAVGANPARIALLDNFCWGNTERPETLGSLVRAALACRDVAIALGTPFISGKDSLNNEFRYTDERGQTQTIAVPPSLLVSALGQIDDVRRAVTMDLKQPGNYLYLVGTTRDELGGSHFALVEGLSGGQVPVVDPQTARRTFAAVHRAIASGCVRACHDLSEGGLAVAVAEMAFAGGFGATLNLDAIDGDDELSRLRHAVAAKLFSESHTRFVCEVASDSRSAFESAIGGDVPHTCLGEVSDTKRLVIESSASGDRHGWIDADIFDLKEAWRAPLRW